MPVGGMPDDAGILVVDGAYVELTCMVDQAGDLEIAQPAQVVDIIQLEKRECFVCHCFTVVSAKY